MKSLEVTRRLQALSTATPCTICHELDFAFTKILIKIPPLYNEFDCMATVCKACGHLDLFLGATDANTDTGGQVIFNG